MSFPKSKNLSFCFGFLDVQGTKYSNWGSSLTYSRHKHSANNVLDYGKDLKIIIRCIFVSQEVDFGIRS